MSYRDQFRAALRRARRDADMAAFEAKTAAADLFLDFAADDSGAMAHTIPCDAYEQFLTAFRAMIAPPLQSPGLLLAG